MTQNELLAKIDSFTCCSGVHELALCAVVELHQPIADKSENYNSNVSCEECQEDYPCLTIQVIQDKLA
jgi:hypothetical protein